jgi:hypothetical protein
MMTCGNNAFDGTSVNAMMKPEYDGESLYIELTNSVIFGSLY